MDAGQARQVLDALIRGVHPEGGTELTSDSLLFTPSIRGALRVAYDALKKLEFSVEAMGKQPRRAGFPWTIEEDDNLRVAFGRGDSVGQLAGDHQRTNGAIKSRLIHLGLLAPEDPILPSVAVPEPDRDGGRALVANGAPTPAEQPLSQELAGKKGYALNVQKTDVFKEDELRVLRRYGFWLEALAERKILPSTAAQEHFCRVVRGEASAETLYERAWMRLVGRREIEPELARDFVLADPGEEWFKREAHWRYQ